VDPQTGLFPQVVTVNNASGTNFPGLRVLVYDLPADLETNMVRVANAHGLSNNIPYFDIGTVLAGTSMQFTVEFYISNRRNKPAPRYEATVMPGPPIVIPPTSFLVNTNATRIVDGKFFAEFPTENNRTYFIQYNSDITVTNGWKTSLPGLRGTGGTVLWQDTGPPRTESLPLQTTSRFYRIVVLP